MKFPQFFSSKCELGKKNAVATNTNENCVYNWLAPEVIFNLPPSFYCDMYSYCVVLWELFHGKFIWKKFKIINMAIETE